MSDRFVSVCDCAHCSAKVAPPGWVRTRAVFMREPVAINMRVAARRRLERTP